jgi:threonine dehydratase
VPTRPAGNAPATPAPVTAADVAAAARRLEGQVLRTPCRHSVTLSEITGATVWLKFENQQFTASFKERGAYHKLSSLTPEERARGVIAMSAGNHAQGVAYHARRLGIPATIVMPRNTPYVKVNYTQGHGARVLLEGATLEESAAFATELAAREGLVFVHPYDDAAVIAGQGTVALEMLADAPALDCLVVPVGGGGLVGGMAVAARAARPGIEVFGVEAELFPSLKCALDGVTRPCGGDTLAEGIAVKGVGRLTLALARDHVTEILLAGEAELERAVSLLLNVEKTLVEGAGAAGLAALLAHPARFRGRTVGIVLSGGNMDPRLLAAILTRELVREGRITRLRITISDVPGQIARIATIVAGQRANFIDLQHQRIFTPLPARDTYLDITLETRDRGHLELVLGELRAASYDVRVLTE